MSKKIFCTQILYLFGKRPKKVRCIQSQLYGLQNYSQYSTIPTIRSIRDSLKDLVGAVQLFGVSDDPLERLKNAPAIKKEDLPPRTTKDSYSEALIPLGSDAVAREKYINLYKGLRFGRILEDLDTFAVHIGYKHNTHRIGNKSPLAIVTALVDRIELQEAPISAFHEIKMSGHVTWVGSSSMEITMDLHQEMNENKWEPVLSARFVMVARNPVTKKSYPVNQLELKTDGDKQIFQLAEKNKIKREEEANMNLLKTQPSAEERQEIHELFLQTLDPSLSTFHARTKPENCVWMEDTILKNMVTCFPEQRNLYSKVFGGFIMRKAFELAWANAALYSKTRPFIRTVDDILFRKPVEIGSLLFLSSQVVYTKGSMLHLMVHAEVVGIDGYHALTNDFYFTFDSKQENLPRVIPKTYTEYMLYLDGKRHFES